MLKGKREKEQVCVNRVLTQVCVYLGERGRKAVHFSHANDRPLRLLTSAKAGCDENLHGV